MLFVGPPPPLPASTSAANCLILLGSLPWWLPDTDLRRLAEQFGQVRSLRVLDHLGSGKSAGIALVEYLQTEAVQRASSAAEGICKLGAWKGLAAPRLVPVGAELLGKLRSGVLPWPDGGPCSAELRSILLRQFDMSHLETSKGGRRQSSPPRTRGGLGRPQGQTESKNRVTEDSMSWADKLKKLKGSVNSREDLGPVSEPPRKVHRPR